MRIAICDDDRIIVDELHRKIDKIIQKLNMNAEIADFTDGNDLLYEIESVGIFDIIFLDIEIGNVNGIDLAAKLNDEEYVYTLIFISQYSLYYRAAFEVQPFWFLDKPFDEDKLETSLKNALGNIRYKYETFDYCFAKEYYRVLIEKILYVQSCGRTIFLCCIDKKVCKFYGKLGKVENELAEKHRKFVRINRSVCVNIDYISKWSYKYVEMVNGEVINIGEKYREKVRESFISWMREKVKRYD